MQVQFSICDRCKKVSNSALYSRFQFKENGIVSGELSCSKFMCEECRKAIASFVGEQVAVFMSIGEEYPEHLTLHMKNENYALCKCNPGDSRPPHLCARCGKRKNEHYKSEAQPDELHCYTVGSAKYLRGTTKEE